MRTRLIRIVCILAIGALVLARTLFSQATVSPVLFSLSLSASLGYSVLDQHTGSVFVLHESAPSPAVTGTYAFASAASYSLAVNGAGVSSVYNSGQIQSLGRVSVLAADGRLLTHDVAVPADPSAAAIDSARGLLYLTHVDENMMSVLDMHKLNLMRTVSVGSRPASVAVSEATGRVFVVNGGDGTVSVLVPMAARTLRTVRVPAAGDGSAEVVDERLARVFVSGMGSLSVLDGHDGTLLTTVRLNLGTSHAGHAGARPASPKAGPTFMAVDERAGRCYVLEPGLLTIVDAMSARILRQITVDPYANAVAIDTRSGHVLLLSPGQIDTVGAPGVAGRVDVLDPRSGGLVQSYTLEISPVALAVDVRANHVVIVGNALPARTSDRWAWLPEGLRRWLPFAAQRNLSPQPQLGRVLLLELSRLDSGSASL
jgi:DNA-binding beta-propeller fold protein YncE